MCGAFVVVEEASPTARRKKSVDRKSRVSLLTCFMHADAALVAKVHLLFL